VYRNRIERAQQIMRERGVDALILGPGSDLLYLTGYNIHSSERLTALLVFAHADHRLYIPELEASRVTDPSLSLVIWKESESPTKLISKELATKGVQTIAVGDQLWSIFLLTLQEDIKHVRWIPASTILAPMRLIKTAEEVEFMKRAGKVADRVWERILTIDPRGLTERKMAQIVSDLLLEEGAEDIAFNIVASGPNSASPHHSPSSRTISEGDMVIFDYGGPLMGYNSDITRTLHVGRVDEEELKVYKAVKEAQQLAFLAVKPGIPAREVDRAARDHLGSLGLDKFFIHRTGHGLGLDVHEPPYITPDSDLQLQEGMVFSIEPGVYIPGKFGVRIEDIVVVTQQGAERLNLATRELIEV